MEPPIQSYKPPASHLSKLFLPVALGVTTKCAPFLPYDLAYSIHHISEHINNPKVNVVPDEVLPCAVSKDLSPFEYHKAS
jgi:hypothetical protein